MNQCLCQTSVSALQVLRTSPGDLSPGDLVTAFMTEDCACSSAAGNLQGITIYSVSIKPASSLCTAAAVCFLLDITDTLVSAVCVLKPSHDEAALCGAEGSSR